MDPTSPLMRVMRLKSLDLARNSFSKPTILLRKISSNQKDILFPKLHQFQIQTLIHPLLPNQFLKLRLIHKQNLGIPGSMRLRKRDLCRLSDPTLHARYKWFQIKLLLGVFVIDLYTNPLVNVRFVIKSLPSSRAAPTPNALATTPHP